MITTPKKTLEFFCVSMSLIYNNYIAYPVFFNSLQGQKKIFSPSPPPHETQNIAPTYIKHSYTDKYIFQFSDLHHFPSLVALKKKHKNSIPSIPSSSSAIHLPTQSHHPLTSVRFQYKMLAVLPVPIINDSHKTENGLVWCVSSI